MKKYFLIGSIVAAVAAGALFGVGYTRVTKTVPVVVAAEPITMDRPISETALKTIDVPQKFADQTGAVRDPKQLVGRYLSVSVLPDQPITKNMMSTVQDLQGLLNQYVSENEVQGVLMQLPVTTALAGHVRPGQDIALLITSQAGNAPVAPSLVSPIHVLAIDTPPDDNGKGKSTLLIFVRQDQFSFVSAAVAANQAQVVMYPSDGEASGMHQSPVGQPTSDAPKGQDHPTDEKGDSLHAK